MENGKLPSAGGRPKGTTLANGRCKVSKPTAERAELLSLWRTEVSKQFRVLVQAQLASAQGVMHMVARDDQGRWTTVTDPDVMVERLNAGDQAYRLSAVAPNATLIGQIMDRLFGQDGVAGQAETDGTGGDGTGPSGEARAGYVGVGFKPG